MKKKENHPIQGTLPFPDLLEIERTMSTTHKRDEPANVSLNETDAILTTKDATLLFMTLAVNMTDKNEMPIVRPYTGVIPSDIRALHRLTPLRHQDIAPHLYFEDERIYRYWNKPFHTAALLRNFTVSIGIDFSMTNEMSRPQKMYASFLNKLWCAWLQSRGHKVIPNISFPDEWQEDYWLEGWPKHSVIAISSVGVLSHGNPTAWLRAMKCIREVLQPIHILRYGPKLPGENEENCTYFNNDNNRSANGW